MSGREWQPGEVAVATVRGVPNVRVFRVVISTDPRWIAESRIKGSAIIFDEDLTDIRPLAVIDPGDREAVRRVLKLFGQQFTAWTPELDHICTKLQAALREFANPTPPKPEEPRGLGAVVEDAEGRKWVRHSNTPGTFPWLREGYGVEGWSNIAAVRVLSEGVTQ